MRQWIVGADFNNKFTVKESFYERLIVFGGALSIPNPTNSKNRPNIHTYGTILGLCTPYGTNAGPIFIVC